MKTRIFFLYGNAFYFFYGRINTAIRRLKFLSPPHCILFTMALSFVILQSSFAQSSFFPVTDWMNIHLTQLGGRAVLLVYKDGKIIYSKSVNALSPRQKKRSLWLGKQLGLSEEESVAPFTPDTYLPIASSSKWLSAALFLTFVEEGLVTLDDSIGKFLPLMTKHGKGNIRMWQCLSHTTGIKDPPILKGIRASQNWSSMEDAIQKIAALPMEGKPGKSFHYGNSGLQILAAVCEKISGKPYAVLFKERITRPLEMPSTDFGKSTVPVAAGGVRSTASDYLHFLMMVLQKGIYGPQQLLSPPLIDSLCINRAGTGVTNQYTPAEARQWGYGFGVWVMDGVGNGNKSNEVTSPGLFGSFPVVDFKRNYCAVLITLNLKSNGRHDRYVELKKRLDKAVDGLK